MQTREARVESLSKRCRKLLEAYKEESFGRLSAEMQRTRAMELLMQIVEGDAEMREQAIAKARTFLQKYHKKNYSVMAHIQTKVIPNIMKTMDEEANTAAMSTLASMAAENGHRKL